MRALVGGLAIVACKSAAAPPEIKTSSVVVADASASSLVVEQPKEDAGSAVEARPFPPLRNYDWEHHDYDGTSFASVAYGDLDGDRREEAVVVARGSRRRSSRGLEIVECELRVFAWRDAKVVEVASMNFLAPSTDVRVTDGKIFIVEHDERGACSREATLEGDHVLLTKPTCRP